MSNANYSPATWLDQFFTDFDKTVGVNRRSFYPPVDIIEDGEGITVRTKSTCIHFAPHPEGIEAGVADGEDVVGVADGEAPAGARVLRLPADAFIMPRRLASAPSTTRHSSAVPVCRSVTPWTSSSRSMTGSVSRSTRPARPRSFRASIKASTNRCRSAGALHFRKARAKPFARRSSRRSGASTRPASSRPPGPCRWR